jgi:hypothetical protein
MSDNEDSTASLGDSEILSVKYPPGDAIPEFDQPAKDGGKIPPPLLDSKPGRFDNNPSRPNLLKNSMELEP